MAVDVFIRFNGNCREVIGFYAEVFRSEAPKIMTYGDMPAGPGEPLTEEVRNLIAYTSLNIHGSQVMFTDVPPGMPYVPGNNIVLNIGGQDMDEIIRLFNRLQEGGTVTMEIQETFWTKAYGLLIDKYGIPWQFSHDSGLMPTF